MPRLDLLSIFKRAKTPAEAFAQRDAALVEWSKSDGYKALLDLYEREMRACFLAFLTEADPAKVRDARFTGKAIWALIRRIDERAATVQAAESVEAFSKRMVEDMKGDRDELQELDRAMVERSLHQPDAKRTSTRPAMGVAY